MACAESISKLRKYVRIVVRWCILSVIMGTVGGLLGAVFHHALHFVTHVRSEHMWLIFLLPLGGLLTVAIYRIPGMKGNKGTNEIIEATLDGHPVSPLVAPSISSQFTYAKLGQVITGLKELGFFTVIEAALGADMVAVSESKELAEKGFLTSSCCPAFVKYIKSTFPDLLPYVSHNLGAD